MLTILQISKKDSGGGAANVARNLHHVYNERKHNAWIAVKEKNEDYSNTITIQNDARLLNRIERRIYSTLGLENYSYPIPDINGLSPDIIHCHNLHNEYFDLRKLPELSHSFPVFLTLHDGWLLTGHCAHPMECERWARGCGRCPDLNRYPAINRDATRINLKRKQDIFNRSRIYVTTPSQWMMNLAHKSILSPAIIESKVIYNGADLLIFKPVNKDIAKIKLNLPPHAIVLLYAGENLKTNSYKNYEIIEQTIKLISQQRSDRQIIFIALGGGNHERIIPGGNVTIWLLPYQNDVNVVANYYQAADIYLHAAHADTFPNVIIEALACGTPVVATAVGGIAEQIDELTGILVPPNDHRAFYNAIKTLIDNDLLRSIMSHNAATIAKHKFDLQTQVDRNLNWYEYTHVYHNSNA